MRIVPATGRLTAPLVRAFGFMLRNPDRWIAAADIAAAASTTIGTVYGRFGNLVESGVLQSKRIGDFKHWRLHPRCDDSPVTEQLRQLARDGHNGAEGPANRPTRGAR